MLKRERKFTAVYIYRKLWEEWCPHVVTVIHFVLFVLGVIIGLESPIREEMYFLYMPFLIYFLITPGTP